MIGKIIAIALIVFVYLVFAMIFGFIVSDDIIDECGFNPIWKIPAALFFPITLVFFLVCALITLFANYIEEVREYYRRKRGD